MHSFLNKQDLPDAMDEIDICKFTTIQQLIDEYQCVVKIVSDIQVIKK